MQQQQLASGAAGYMTAGHRPFAPVSYPTQQAPAYSQQQLLQLQLLQQQLLQQQLLQQQQQQQQQQLLQQPAPPWRQ
jgi:hypothetical protein